MNELAGGARISRDIDLFHDTSEALATSWAADRQTLESNGYAVAVLHERETFVEAIITKQNQKVAMQWTRDSAFRFFPLVEHPDFGLSLHPFDLATNKVLALVGRVEARDWVDIITCSENLQHLGLLAWAACGKDPGFSPIGILDHAARSSRYTREEIESLVFSGSSPDAADLSRRWHSMLEEARGIVRALPAGEAGHCVLDACGKLLTGTADFLSQKIAAGEMHFHAGRIRGAFPRMRNLP
ncbi:MAG: hypothetical protein K1X53_15185 [Candidatus Sumerlaeaceae bacterium]|nr:hypothetical protein [Candidatus Sumerlaeaceae bacterium]